MECEYPLILGFDANAEAGWGSVGDLSPAIGPATTRTGRREQGSGRSERWVSWCEANGLRLCNTFAVDSDPSRPIWTHAGVWNRRQIDFVATRGFPAWGSGLIAAPDYDKGHRSDHVCLDLVASCPMSQSAMTGRLSGLAANDASWCSSETRQHSRRLAPMTPLRVLALNHRISNLAEGDNSGQATG